MRLSAETQHLMEKRLKQALQPLEISLCAGLSAIEFFVVYSCCTFGLRYHEGPVASLVILVCLMVCVTLSVVAGFKYRGLKKSRAWIALAVAMWIGLASGYTLGDQYWYKNTVNYYNLKDMASYVNIDPATDKGQSYMDAGTVYFKEGSYVLTSKAVAFRNGLTYCVAPIVRAPLTYDAGSGSLQTVSGFSLPKSGTVDFWAVGTDCCGRNGDSFHCGEVRSQLARSGLRLMDETARSMYLLAVQEWSASTGLPVRHPIFFHWVQDPVIWLEKIINNAWEDLWLYLVGCFAASLFTAFLLHAAMKQLNIH